MKIKVCGMTDAQNIKQVEKLDVDYIGFIFYPKSARYIETTPTYMPQKAKRVGVFVNSPLDEIVEKAREFNLDYIQLHGKESPEFCSDLYERGFKIIKAISVGNKEDIEAAYKYQTCCNYLLFDTHCSTYGGSGNKFNWDLLGNYNGNVPFFLSGGIKPEAIPQLKQFIHPKLYAIDLNSGFETKPGMKDPELLKMFITQLKKFES